MIALSATPPLTPQRRQAGSNAAIIAAQLRELALYCDDPDLGMLRDELSHAPGYGSICGDPAYFVAPSQAEIDRALTRLSAIAAEIRALTTGPKAFDLDDWLARKVRRWGVHAPHIADDCERIAQLIERSNG